MHHSTTKYFEVHNKYESDFGIDLYSNTDQVSGETHMKSFAQWKEKQKLRDWYNCKGCKTVKYCSRRCQKISWNIFEHQKQCVQIKQNHKQYF